MLFSTSIITLLALVSSSSVTAATHARNASAKHALNASTPLAFNASATPPALTNFLTIEICIGTALKPIPTFSGSIVVEPIINGTVVSLTNSGTVAGGVVSTTIVNGSTGFFEVSIWGTSIDGCSFYVTAAGVGAPAGAHILRLDGHFGNDSSSADFVIAEVKADNNSTVNIQAWLVSPSS